jgi:HTH-type transcriptional regulator/antitoxin HigA
VNIAKILLENLKKDIKVTRPKIGESYKQLVELFPLRSITTQDEHELALKVIEKLLSGIAKKEDEGVKIYIMTLSELVSDYEQQNYKASVVSGRDMLEYLMDLRKLTQKDLAKELGGQPIVSKILSGERELNIRQIKALAKRFKVSPEVFI